MIRSARHFASPALALHLLVLGVFALALLLRPVLTTYGEIHELAHAGAGMHQSHGGHAGSTNEVSDASDADENPALHTLLHLAHCCGQSTPVAAPVWPAFDPARASAVPGLADYDAPAAAPTETPFRPPIAA